MSTPVHPVATPLPVLLPRAFDNQAAKKDARGLPETFSKRLLVDNRWKFVACFVLVQAIVWHCSCVLGCVKCCCGFGAQMLWAAVKGMAQNYLFNMDPGTPIHGATVT